MTVMRESALTFIFPEQWEVSKLDDWQTYRQRFITLDEGIRCVDFLAFDGRGEELWMIEVKNYSLGRKDSLSELIDAIVNKVRNSHGVISAACWQSDYPEERRLARLAMRKASLKIALHIEQPRHRSRLHPKPLVLVTLKQSLRKRLSKIAATPQVVDRQRNHLPWQVH
ncbi:hypothetical protein NS2R_05225 [Pseudomonas oryzihabitans]|nr:hypothetical protein BJP27_23680 [Pseudomonas psychrotolerans]KTT13102.1 hypothetical protein NS2R_05225 [Pseudomonas psychrotolerans]